MGKGVRETVEVAPLLVVPLASTVVGSVEAPGVSRSLIVLLSLSVLKLSTTNVSWTGTRFPRCV